MKEKNTALLLSIFAGLWGMDRFYLGYTGLGVLKLLTLGCFGILSLIDMIRIATGKLKPANGSEYADVAAYAYLAQKAAESLSENLEKAAKLLQEGAITEAEFNKLRTECLEKL